MWEDEIFWPCEKIVLQIRQKEDELTDAILEIGIAIPMIFIYLGKFIKEINDQPVFLSHRTSVSEEVGS